MPNGPDTDRLESKLRDGNVVSIDAYRQAAARKTNVSMPYVAPSALMAILGIIVLFFLAIAR